MIIHYLKITLRKLGKNYIFASINIGGLVIALACAFLIFHFVLSELTTDHFNKNKDDIYKTIVSFDFGHDDGMSFYGSSFIFAENIRDKFPEIIDVTRLHSLDFNNGGQYILQNEEAVKALNFIAVDASFFSIFSIDILNGSAENSLPDIRSLLLSESMSEKFFPNENPVGKTLRVENTTGTRTFLITGVFKDLPSNSTIQANFIGHIELSAELYRSRVWEISGTDTYIQLKKGSKKEDFINKLNDFAKLQHPDQKYSYSLQGLTDVYFHSDSISFNSEPVGNYKLIRIYIIIGIIILLIASINYIIITTASSTERMTEIGIRKVMGAQRATIIKQLITESVLVSLIAFPLAIITSELVTPTFNLLLGKQLQINYLNNWPYSFGILLITLLISLLSGSYISLFVSKFSPEQIFKKRFSSNNSKFNFRKILIAIQIIAFMILFSFSAIIIKQINFILNKDIGFDYENLVNVIPPHVHSFYGSKSFKDEILKNPSIESVSEVYAGIYSSVFYKTELSSSSHPEEFVEFDFLSGDHNYAQILDFKLIEGRFFEENRSSDTAAIILNKTAVQKMNLDNPLNQVLLSESGKRYRVIGIIDDFHFSSMHSAIMPMGIIVPRKETMVCQILVKINPQQVKETIAFLESSWKDYGPAGKFDYEFVKNVIENEYQDDRNFSNTIQVLTLITVLIAAFGIFGFSFYNARQRVKETGIRKVYGANLSDIIKMIYKELGILLVLSGVIAIPVAYIISDKWLSNYAYRIDFPYWIFAIVFVISIIIVFATTGLTALNAANKNPVDSLRYE